jgi:hypothetical protein
MQHVFGFWPTAFASGLVLLVGIAVAISRYFMSGKESRAQFPLNTSATLLLLSALTPWLMRTFYVAESLRVFSHEAAINDVFRLTEPEGPSLYKSLGHGLLSGMRRDYTSLMAGNAPVVGYNESMDLYREFITASCSKGNMLRATSMIRGSSWTPEQRQVNTDFLNRGGAVRRVFICANEEQKKQALIEARLQRNGCSGKKCPDLWLLDLRDLDPLDIEIRASARDFILNVEEKVAIEFHVSDGQLIGASLVSDEGKVDRLLVDHKRLESKSNAIPPK